MQATPESLPSFDLVVPTVGNVPELRRLLDSLVDQRYPGLRVIVVDKSRDERLASLLHGYRGELAILHIPAAPCGVSKAVNIGREHVSAELVGIPDDDCWYPAGFLRAVAERFSTDPGLTGLSVMQVESDLRPSHGRWARRAGPVTRTNVWGRGVGPGIFYRRVALEAVGPFDESLGVGSGRWEAGLETDLLIRVVDRGGRVEYEPNLFVFHPGPENGKKYSVDRWRSYGEAMGHVMRKHRFPISLAVYHCSRPVVGAALAVMRGEGHLAHRRLATAHGRFAGWLAEPGSAKTLEDFAQAVRDSAAGSLGHVRPAGEDPTANAGDGLPSIDLVVPTLGRPNELRRLLDSAVAQDYRPLRVIVIDMNDDDSSTAPVLDEFSTLLEIVHMRIPRRGVSGARNLAMQALSSEIVSLSDDDCWFPPSLLSVVGERFRRDPNLAGLSVMERDASLLPSNGRWASRPGPITRTNVWGRGVSAGIFVKAGALRAMGGFDETLGGGSGAWEAGEETDLLIRLVDGGYRIRYDPSIFVYHPDPRGEAGAAFPIARWRSYAKSTGHLMRKHRYPLHVVAYRCARPLLGSAASVLRGDLQQSRIRLAVTTGRVQGWAQSSGKRARG